MNKPKILVTMPKHATFYTFFDDKRIKQLESLGEVIWNESISEQLTEEQLIEQIKDIDVIVTGWGTRRLEESIVKHATRLKLVAHTGGSVYPYVSDYVYERGITVVSGNNIFAESVAESVIAYALAALRDIPKYSTELKQGLWPNDYYNRGLLNKKIGIVGFGMIAKYVVNMLKPFHPELFVFTKGITEQELKHYELTEMSLEDMFETCDIISLHLSSTEETYRMINEPLLSKMKNGTLLINTARGAIVDEQALVRVLQQNKSIVAALDVYEVEPLPSDHPLLTLDNVMLMPHMGGPTVDRRFIVTDQIIQEITHFYNNEPLICEISHQYAKTMTR